MCKSWGVLLGFLRLEGEVPAGELVNTGAGWRMWVWPWTRTLDLGPELMKRRPLPVLRAGVRWSVGGPHHPSFQNGADLLTSGTGPCSGHVRVVGPLSRDFCVEWGCRAVTYLTEPREV